MPAAAVPLVKDCRGNGWFLLRCCKLAGAVADRRFAGSY